jgi:hypothetical protein
LFPTAGLIPRDTADNPKALTPSQVSLSMRNPILLLAHCDWAGPDGGMYAFTNDIDTRQWHGTVKKALGHRQALGPDEADAEREVARRKTAPERLRESA